MDEKAQTVALWNWYLSISLSSSVSRSGGHSHSLSTGLITAGGSAVYALYQYGERVRREQASLESARREAGVRFATFFLLLLIL